MTFLRTRPRPQRVIILIKGAGEERAPLLFPWQLMSPRVCGRSPYKWPPPPPAPTPPKQNCRRRVLCGQPSLHRARRAATPGPCFRQVRSPIRETLMSLWLTLGSLFTLKAGQVQNLQPNSEPRAKLNFFREPQEKTWKCSLIRLLIN